MAQRSGKRQPVYSADTLALRYIGGLGLVALGVIMFLAVELNLAGNVFDALRQICYGLTGGLAVILPALPVWAGVLVIWSSQRKAPVKPFAYASLAFLGLCAFIALVTKVGAERTEFLRYLSNISDGSWGGVIQQGYQRSMDWRAGGGALGVILAYPFWSLVGTILGVVLVALLTLLCMLLAVNLTPARIRNLVSGQEVWSLRRKPQDQAAQDQQQIAFQQEQERQRQMAYAQQQAYILQQQQLQQQQAAQAAQMARQPSGRWTAPAQQQPAQQVWPDPSAGTGVGQPWTGNHPAVTDNSVLDWQQQLTSQKALESTGRKSRIFGNQENQEQKPHRSSIFDLPQEAEQPRVSRIFGRKKDQDDGLSDLSEQQKRQEGMAYPSGSRLRAQQTARQPLAVEQTPAEAPRANEQAAQGTSVDHSKSSRVRQEQAQVEEDLNPWRRQPEEENPGVTARELPWVEENPAETKRTGLPEEAFVRNPPARPAQSALEKEDTRPKAEAPKNNRNISSPWMEQVLAAENASRQEEPEEIPPARGERKPEQLQIPVVQETISDPIWKPELKHVEPKDEEPEDAYWEPTPYYAPPITDLKKPDMSVLDTSQEDEERSRRLEATLASFKVQAQVVHVTHGPAISRFELELAPGTKVNKVAELEKDIAYGMQATSVRIEAPIPGKGLVGVEVPNPKRATVTLREVLESPQMQNAKSILTVALGKDIAGVPIICDLAKMPHMLIAGATGSGKSVCINTIINSLLYRAGPDEVKMILVDPKVVELQCYNGIPHLLLPVVNDPHKASAALAWAVAEMMDRYDKFAERGVRNLEGYNSILDSGEKPMPRIVIIIDELADLMMVCKKDVEEYICRITQLARAAGIHLIVATQRPSVDVITGLIKANIPSRIAFKTASSVDSRTILDRNGSEQLLGLGDMLYSPTGSFSPIRIQGCFLSDEEVNRIADHVRQANPSAYDPDVLDKLEQLTKGQEESPTMDMIGGTPENSSGDADLFEQAVEYAIADGQISTSTLQRRLKVGYARAGRLTDEMEERGIVAAKDGSKPRKCLITREQWEEMKATAEAS